MHIISKISNINHDDDNDSAACTSADADADADDDDDDDDDDDGGGTYDDHGDDDWKDDGDQDDAEHDDDDDGDDDVMDRCLFIVMSGSDAFDRSDVTGRRSSFAPIVAGRQEARREQSDRAGLLLSIFELVQCQNTVLELPISDTLSEKIDRHIKGKYAYMPEYKMQLDNDAQRLRYLFKRTWEGLQHHHTASRYP